ncbi:hypothetical protein OV207_03830 [Corallococcus sp. BB11-1]|uniref:hypothetical protein n=1 Tax=Corallococcus sp. BB11-1 TaxID=2996783 RepID=UPI0022716D48|nr:hypothetical protein [Corallococcus sp. BB11-1]MCY1030575.1 hypothetical protein [Corallococcus sp. BB11-1]
MLDPVPEPPAERPSEPSVASPATPAEGAPETFAWGTMEPLGQGPNVASGLGPALAAAASMTPMEVTVVPAGQPMALAGGDIPPGQASLEDPVLEGDLTAPVLPRAEASPGEGAPFLPRVEEGRFAFLARAGEVLASSLDEPTVLRQLAALVVPALADWCTVDLLTPTGAVVRRAAAHRDSTLVPEILALADDCFARGESLAGVPRVLATGQPLLVSEVPEAQAREAMARGDRMLARAWDLGCRSVMLVPLEARGAGAGMSVIDVRRAGAPLR